MLSAAGKLLCLSSFGAREMPSVAARALSYKTMDLSPGFIDEEPSGILGKKRKQFNGVISKQKRVYST